MKKLKNLKIKFKLYGLSALLIFSLLFTSVISLVLMADVNDGSTVVASNWLPSVILAEELNTATSDFRILELHHVVSQNQPLKSLYEQQIVLSGAEIYRLFTAYETEYITNETDRILLEQAHALWDEYLLTHVILMEYSRNMDTSSAMTVVEGESRAIFEEVSSLFLELVQFNKEGAEAASLDGDRIYSNTKFVACVTVLVTLVVGTWASSFIISSVVKPVTEIETAAAEILKGELSTLIEYKAEDELGNLSQSMRKLCNMFQEVIEDLGYMLEGMAEGDFSVESQRKELYVGDFAPLLSLTKHISQKLSEAIFTLHHRDTLTGLYNRTGYSERIDEIMAENPKTMGVLSININGLKQINENVGITGGDQHIKHAAQALTAHFDYEFFRMSGDELVGIAPDVAQESFESKVNTLLESMHRSENYDFALGFAWDKGNYNLFKLMQEADTVMYINKQEYYAVSDRKFDNVDNVILSELLSFLEEEEFMIYLQPQVYLSDGSLYGAEALIRRFDKKNQKMVFPDQFISLYEQKSVIRHVDIFVVEAVCKLLAQWQAEDKAIPISVNLSRVTLLEFGIVDTIVKICDRYQVPHEYLVIEVTERVGLIENNVASSLIIDFKSHGFHISLDDFGCAYSNIVTLAQIEVDEVKIDKSLVDDLTTNKKNHILVKNVLSMCNELEGTSTLAEGIEDQAQADLLHQLHCHLGQGYYFSRPLPVADFISRYIHPENS